MNWTLELVGLLETLTFEGYPASAFKPIPPLPLVDPHGCDKGGQYGDNGVAERQVAKLHSSY